MQTWACIAALLLCSSCVGTKTVHCGDRVCAEGAVCAPDGVTCTTQSQVDACAHVEDGTGCSYPGTASGVCRAEVCIPAGCGNAILEPGEVCDDGNRVSLDGCRSDCLSQEVCGDGVVEPSLGEQCDCGADAATKSAACSMPNANTAGAECRTSCTPSRCGDGTVDPEEQCDDGNDHWGDGCRADCQGRFYVQQTPSARPLYGVWAVASDLAFAVGAANTVLQYNGTAWSALQGPPTSSPLIQAVWASSATDLYVSAQATVNVGELWHWNGAAWSQVTLAGVRDFSGIWGSSATDVWVVGQSQSSTGVVWHLSGTTWSHETSVEAMCSGCMTYRTVWGVGSGRVWIGGDNGSLELTNGTWTSSARPAFAITASSATDVYLASGSALFRGTSLATMNQVPLVSGIDGFAAIGNELVVAEGSGIVTVYDGTSWTHLVTPTSQQLNSVSATSSTNVFIVGQSGTVLH